MKWRVDRELSDSASGWGGGGGGGDSPSLHQRLPASYPMLLVDKLSEFLFHPLGQKLLPRMLLHCLFFFFLFNKDKANELSVFDVGQNQITPDFLTLPSPLIRSLL